MNALAASRAGVLPAGAAARLGRLAVRALHGEATLAGKPGLVGPEGSGAHTDMTLATFQRSLFALRGYFPDIAALGAAGADLAQLRGCGRAAEVAMLRATGGVNTHRGAVFHLGLLCAASGALVARDGAVDAYDACEWVGATHGAVLRGEVRMARGATHGAAVARSLGVGGARTEAAGGYASVRGHALPALRAAFAATGDRGRAALHALFALIAHVDDSNLAWRGGRAGLDWARAAAGRFLADGGALTPDWRQRAAALRAAFIARRLSPGGSADLLAVALFLDALDAGGWRPR